MMEIIKKILALLFRQTGGGLIEEPDDPRDFNFGEVFGFPKLDELPDEYIIPVLEWHHQHNSDMCTGFAIAESSEDQEEIPLHPEFQFMVGKKVRGNWSAWGNSIRAALKGAVKYGSIPLSFAPDMVLNKKSRNFLANWNNWDKKYFDEAKKYKKQSYFNIKDNRVNVDRFDLVRVGMWGNRKFNRTIVTGANWRGTWNHPKDGIIPLSNSGSSVGHMFEIIGWKQIKEKPYLVIYPNYGHSLGDNGLLYMSREVANAHLSFGFYSFVDIPVDLAKILSQYSNKVVGSGTAPLYLIQGGKKRHIPSQNVLNALGFKDELGEGGYQIIPASDIQAIPEGEPIKTAELSDHMQQLFTRNSLS